MFEITHQQLRDRSFVTGMRKVLDHEFKEFKTSYNLGRMGTALSQEQSLAHTSFEKLIKAHGKLGDNGQFEIPDENVIEWKKAQEDFLGHTIKVDRHKIRIECLEGIPLTPAEVAAMEPILDGTDGLSS